jgi:hypothetical protein
VANGVITSDEVTAGGLRVWLTGHDPVTGEERGHQRLNPDADLLLDGGRCGIFDIRAGAMRAPSRTGVVAERDRLDGVIAEITERATGAVYRLISDDPPAHVKAFMATETVRTKVRLAGRLDVPAQPGLSLLPGELHRLAPNEDLSALDASQSVAACAIAGTDGLVPVTGPAGAGKTTMLRAASAALASQRRRMLVVAPTRKAASVASREVRAAASSIHALLSDHGYRWGTDKAGAKVWTRLRVGEGDPRTGAVYARTNPVRAAFLRSDRRRRSRHGRPADGQSPRGARD